VLVSLLTAFEPAVAGETEKALRFYQSHFFMGPCQVTVTKDAVRLDNTGPLNFVMVSRAPSWRVTIFRDDDKSYFSESLADFGETGLVSTITVPWKEKSVQPFGYRSTSYKFCGLNAVRMTKGWEVFKFLPLKDALNAAPEVEKLFYAIYKCPTNGGIPLCLTGINGGKDFMGSTSQAGARLVYLDTSKVVELDVPSSIFAAPVGYKKAASVREVVAGAQSRRQSKDLDEMFSADRDQLRK